MTVALANKEIVKSRPILLVEDNPMDVDLTLRACMEHQVPNSVNVCRDGEEALLYIDRHGSSNDPMLPVIVLLDLRLPKVSGMEVLAAARKHAVWKMIPIVMLTTSRENTDISQAYELGISSYLVKPVDFTEFTGLIEAIKTYWLQANQPPFPLNSNR